MKKATVNILFGVGATLCCVGIIVILFFGFFSATDHNELFRQKLNAIDALILEDKNDKALLYLKSLRKKANSSVQYLSIVKRQLQLQVPVAALQTLQLGLKHYPEDDKLVAVLVHTLMHEHYIADAVTYAPLLKKSPYAGIGAYAFICADKKNGTYSTPVAFWKEGFHLTNEHVFLENAGLLLACEGKVAEAAELRSLISTTDALASPYFWSCLAYDTGNFKPVLDDLFYSLAYADMTGLPEKDPAIFEYARRHLLLAADASAGMQDTEQARGYWLAYIDRYPDAAQDVFYNLAMTAPSEKEKIDLLVDCIAANPAYYPAVAQYVRALAKMKETYDNQDSVTEFLRSKNFFSLAMEKDFFLSAKFRLSADTVLNNAINTENSDVRFLLERFRHMYNIPKKYAQGNGEMWHILESSHDDPLVRSYARWYFSHIGDFNACFTVADTGDVAEDSFYNGLRYTLEGDSIQALQAFTAAEQDSQYHCTTSANKGYVYEARGEGELAIREFTRAESLTDNIKLKSKLLYEKARLYATRNGEAAAIKFAKQSLTLDAENYRAAALLRQLENAQ